MPWDQGSGLSEPQPPSVKGVIICSAHPQARWPSLVKCEGSIHVGAQPGSSLESVQEFGWFSPPPTPVLTLESPLSSNPSPTCLPPTPQQHTIGDNPLCPRKLSGSGPSPSPHCLCHCGQAPGLSLGLSSQVKSELS